MFIRKPILLLFGFLVAIAMLAEALLVARVKEVFVVHEYHGLLNGKVGAPYQELIHELLVRYDAGDMESLGRALQAAEDGKHEMNHVWLGGKTPDAYKNSVDRILK